MLLTRKWVSFFIGRNSVAYRDYIKPSDRLFCSQVRPSHYRRNSFECQLVVAVTVATQDQLDISFLQQINDFIPVIQRRVLRIVIDENNRYLRIFEVGQSRIEPYNILS